MIKQLQFSLCAGVCLMVLFCFILLGWFGFFSGGGWALLFVCFVVVVCCFSRTLRCTPSARYYFLEGLPRHTLKQSLFTSRFIVFLLESYTLGILLTLALLVLMLSSR